MIHQQVKLNTIRTNLEENKQYPQERSSVLLIKQNATLLNLSTFEEHFKTLFSSNVSLSSPQQTGKMTIFGANVYRQK